MHQGARRDRQPRGRATGRARVGGRHPARSRLGQGAARRTPARMATAFRSSFARSSIPAVPAVNQSGYTDGAGRPGSGGERHSRPTQRRDGRGHPCSMTNECAWRCSNLCKTAERGADGVRRRLRHDQCIPFGLNQSTVLRRRFAKVKREDVGRSRMPIDRTRRTKISP